MPSNAPAEIDLVFSATAEETEWLNRVRELDCMDSHQYLAFLLEFAPMHPPGREIPPFHEPFKL
jgi:hypothetical protein